MKTRSLVLGLVLLMLLLLSVAPAAQATPLFPFAPGYTLTYSDSEGGLTWKQTDQITGTTNLGGYQWWVVKETNGIDSYGTTNLRYFRVTDTALYVLGYIGGPDFQTGPVNFSWTLTEAGESGPTTATIEAITSVTVPAGTFSNVYEVLKVCPSDDDIYVQYWKPGVGLLNETDPPGYETGPGGYTMVLTSITNVPIPGALWLMGSGLVELIGLRRKFSG